MHAGTRIGVAAGSGEFEAGGTVGHMGTLWPAIIGAIALVGIPVGAWLSRRFTKESRLLLRIERLSAAHAGVPESEQRAALGRRILIIVEELNDWIDVPKENLRVLQRIVSGAVFVVGVVGVVALTAELPDPTSYIFAQVTGGVVIAFLATGSSALLERLATRRAESRKSAELKAEEAARFDALRRGEAPPATKRALS